jgi:hypothetical protein
VVTLDRRKLTAPLLAQAAAFVAVLAIGLVTGHSGGKPAPVPSSHSTSPAPRHSTGPAPRISVTSGGTSSTGLSTELTIQIQVGNFGLAMPNVQVEILKDPALTRVAHASLNQNVTATTKSVPAGHAYQVCAKPPQGWTINDQDDGAVPHWNCTPVPAGTQTQTVTFSLTPELPSQGTGGL